MINVNDSRSSSRSSSHGHGHGQVNNIDNFADGTSNYGANPFHGQSQQPHSGLGSDGATVNHPHQGFGSGLGHDMTQAPLQRLGSGGHRHNGGSAHASPSPSLSNPGGGGGSGGGGNNNFGGVSPVDSRHSNSNHLVNGNGNGTNGNYQQAAMQSSVKLECPSPASSRSQPQSQPGNNNFNPGNIDSSNAMLMANMMQQNQQQNPQQFFHVGHVDGGSGNERNQQSIQIQNQFQNQNANQHPLISNQQNQIQNQNQVQAISNIQNQNPPPIQLCASCDRCRARKTKCDGGRPCGNCANRFKKQNKLGAETTVEELRELVVDYAEFDCVYSPAKRRGPIPGKTGASQGQNQGQNQNRGQVRKAGDMVAMMGMPVGQGWNGQGQMQGQMQGWQGLDQGQEYFGTAASATTGISAATAHQGGGGFGTEASAAGFGMTNLNNNNRMTNNNNSMTNNNNMTNSMNNNNNNNNNNNISGSDELKQILALQQQLLLQQQQLQEHQRNQGVMGQLATMVGGLNPQNLNNSSGSAQGTIPHFNQLQPQQQLQHPQQQQHPRQQQLQQQQHHSASNTPFALSSQQQLSHQYSMEDRSTKRAHRSTDGNANNADSKNQAFSAVIANHLHLLHPNNDDGKILRSYYQISVNDVLNLPPIPSDEEYLLRLANAGPNYNNNYNSNNNNNDIPLYDQAALQAARFAELSLGALANNQAPLALELSNASVMCLRNCIEEPGHELCLYDIARAYLLLGIFRSYRGDVVRYFKYRRVCMSHVARLRGVPHVDALVAAISFHDSWAYMIHNASEENIPDIDDVLPRPGGCGNATGPGSHSADIAGDATNKNWIQGAPSIFLDNEAPAINRSLDALACAVRSCCDQANLQVEEMARQAGMDMPGSNSCAGGTATAQAVMANENELCSRNIVLSAQTLLNQHAGTSAEKTEKHGLRLMVLSMEAFLDGGDEDNTGGFTDKQVKNLLKVCEIILKNPHLLHAPGPLYHMVSNVAILLCHLLNGMHANCSASAGSSSESNGGVEGVLFDEVMDSFMAVRKLLNLHRKCLPVRLRCHGIPKPNVGPFRKTMSPEAPFVDLGETLMCASRGCQGFVLMGCSPCVAAERAMSAAKAHAREGDNVDEDEFQRELGDLGDDFNLDDDTLFNILSRIVQN